MWLGECIMRISICLSFHCFQLGDTCGTLSDPFNGKVTITRMTLGGVALYSCDSGYKLEGNAQRTCGLFGVWSGVPPTCKRKWKVCSCCEYKPRTVIAVYT